MSVSVDGQTLAMVSTVHLPADVAIVVPSLPRRGETPDAYRARLLAGSVLIKNIGS